MLEAVRAYARERLDESGESQEVRARYRSWTSAAAVDLEQQLERGDATWLEDFDTIQYRARKVAEDICLALQGSLLVRHGHPAVAEAFLTSRMGGQWGGAFGTMPAGLDLAPILERVLVK